MGSGSSEACCPFDGLPCMYGSAFVSSCDDATSLQMGVDLREGEPCVRAVGKVIKPKSMVSFRCPSDRLPCLRYFDAIHFGLCTVINEAGATVFQCSRLKDFTSCGWCVESEVPKYLLSK